MFLKLATAFSIFILTSSAMDSKPSPEDSSGWRKLAKQDGFDLGERIAYTAHSNYLNALVPLETYEETKDMTALETAVIHLNAAAVRRHPGALKMLFELMSDENIPYEFDIVRIPEGLNFRSLPFMTASEVIALPKSEQLEIVRRSEISEILKSPELTALFFELTADFYPDVVRKMANTFITVREKDSSSALFDKKIQPKIRLKSLRSLTDAAINSQDPFKIKVAQLCLVITSSILDINGSPSAKTVESYFFELIGALISIIPKTSDKDDHLFFPDISDSNDDFITDVIDENYMSAGFLYRLISSHHLWADVHERNSYRQKRGVIDQTDPPLPEEIGPNWIFFPSPGSNRPRPIDETTWTYIAQYFSLLGWKLHHQHPNLFEHNPGRISIHGFDNEIIKGEPDAAIIYHIPNTTEAEKRVFVLRTLYQSYQTAKTDPRGFNYLILAQFNIKGIYNRLWHNCSLKQSVEKMRQFCVKYLHTPSLDVFAKNIITELAFYADRIISDPSLLTEDKGDILGDIAGIFNRLEMFADAEKYYLASFKFDPDSANLYGLYECYKREGKLNQLHEILALDRKLKDILPDFSPEFMCFYQIHCAWLKERDRQIHTSESPTAQ